MPPKVPTLRDEEYEQTIALRDQAAATKAQSEAASTNTWLIVGAVIIAAALLAWAIRGRPQPPPPAAPER